MGECERAVAAALKELEEARSDWMKSRNDAEIVEIIYKHSKVLFAFALHDTLWRLFTWSLSSGQPRVANLVLDYNGLDIQTMGDAEQTLLHVAAGTNFDMTQRLVESGAKINATDRVGRTPLHSAVVGSAVETVAYLVEKGANVKAKTKHEETLLHAAVRKGTLSTIKCLVKNSAGVNAVETRIGRTPLHLYVSKKHPKLEVVQWLVEHGADPQIKDRKGRTAAQLARVKGHGEIARYLDPTLETQLDSPVLSFSPPPSPKVRPLEATSGNASLFTPKTL